MRNLEFLLKTQINMAGKQVSTIKRDDNVIATQTGVNLTSRAWLSSWNVTVLKAPPWRVVKSLWKPLRHNATPPDGEWNVFRAEEWLKNIQSDIIALRVSFFRVWGPRREGWVNPCWNLMGWREEGAESRVKMLVLHVEAAGGTQERLAGAVCAMTFQAFCRGPCRRRRSQGWVQTG